ncbi:metal-dependent hydrolase [Novipirellula artificiosorum]|uniref:UPF0173 metal-dependent hydrolase Poly41_03960 n=1 Tax=Novipirellula artificiosorum TaxID=2528016 RepID=A0A5C6DZR0_9BACT|nr:metal-dependent hydrolase [Novipirellula artificiosorum]TWU42100.1 metal-dependent hydrolase [Novipirellula artificiosorum]
MTKLTWLSHSSWLIETDVHKILLDPFFKDNPAATVTSKDFKNVSHILISHGHFDHVADAASIAKQSGAMIIAPFEIAQWFTETQHVKSTFGMNLGGSAEFPFGSVKMIPALHSSQLPDGSYGGNPAGFLLSVDSKRIYFACDTALFTDMRLYAHQVDLAIVPIGDVYTMGIDDSIRAIKLIEPAAVMPTHYNTWPPIEQDAEEWASRVTGETSATPIVLRVNSSFVL